MMKRSEFGFNEWIQFCPAISHDVIFVECPHAAWEATLRKNINYFAYDRSLEEAMRKCTEKFCKDKDIPLPWERDKPDFSTWTREQCEDYFKEQKCNWRTYNDYTEESRGGNFSIELQPPFNGGFGCEIGGPKLIDYQRAAEYVWTKVNK